ncbi:MAG TPA: heparinase II/III family protein, partial [Lacipirellulaceae bacterium]|nr:heparinase II/III family protein [Lacipirellulaceae bacterium]
LVLPCQLPADDYDQFLFCITFSEQVQLAFDALVDGHWTELKAYTPGCSSRQEITCPIPRGAVTALQVRCYAMNDQAAVVRVHWFGVSHSALTATMERRRRPQGKDWDGLINDDALGRDPVFARGLFFDDAQLAGLRTKRGLPVWDNCFQAMEQRAVQYLERSPEHDLDEYLPWSDERYIRARERGRQSYFWEPLTLGLVGLVNADHAMIRHAIRYLLCMVHTTHWCQSAESRAVGSTWNQRCFLEEMACTSVAILTDWFAYALTDQAKALVYHSLWDKGLASIERDMMKCSDVHSINQGVWFSRGRILAGLMLEQNWPHVGQYVDRAYEDLRTILERYIKPDGGIDEGMGYFNLSASMALQSLIAYSRARGIVLASLLPARLTQCEAFFATLSAVTPGRLLMEGDNSTDRLTFDAIPILASVYPDSVYSKVLACALHPEERSFTYFDHYDPPGVFGFMLGPDEVPAPQCIVPTFSQLPYVGHLSSLRRRGRRSLRMHLSGSMANPSHSHFDRGAFTVEVDGRPVLIDRGIVRYDHPACFSLKRTSLHNTLTPVRADGSYPDQLSCERAVIPCGYGDEEVLQAAIDLSHPWRDQMSRCMRTITSPHCDVMQVNDEGSLLEPGRVAFHLHSPYPFEIDSDEITVGPEHQRLKISASWARNVRHSQDLIDHRFEPVFHLVLESADLSDFSLVTTLQRVL